jgi:hypothetical protein
MKYTVSVFLIATVLLASTRAAPVPLSDDALLDDDFLEDVVGSVVPEVDVDLSSDSDRFVFHQDTHEHEYCTPWPECKHTNIEHNGVTHQYATPTTCSVCSELKGGVCQPKQCPIGKNCQVKDNAKKGLKAGLCG